MTIFVMCPTDKAPHGLVVTPYLHPSGVIGERTGLDKPVGLLPGLYSS
jgi:hypothetical protein